MTTVASSWQEYRQAVETKTQPRTLQGAFVAGMKAAMDILADPYRCPTCLDRADELGKEIEAVGGKRES